MKKKPTRTQPNLECVEDFKKHCKIWRIHLKVWWGYSVALGCYGVCYGGNLRDCEEAENRFITSLARKYNCRFCYVFPVPEHAEST